MSPSKKLPPVKNISVKVYSHTLSLSAFSNQMFANAQTCLLTVQANESFLCPATGKALTF